MLKYIELKGIKSFSNESIEISNLTILTGLNNSGKSTAIQSLRMIFQGLQNDSPYIKGYGGYKELKSKNTVLDDSIVLKIESSDGKVSLLNLNENEINYSQKDINKYFEYIAADRYGPSSILPIMGEELNKITVGSKGEYAVDYYLKFEYAIVHENMKHKKASANTLKHHLIAWMSEISPGLDLSFEIMEKHDISHLEVDGFRATNAGFGISYVLPIILAALVMTSDGVTTGFKSKRDEEWFSKLKSNPSLLLIENPEAHLHPKGQTAMGIFLALAASAGIQVIVETHSDHFVDGVRIAVKNYKAQVTKNILIHYLQKNSNGVTEKNTITIKDNGKLDHWPDGFCDQMSVNLRELAKK